MRLRSPFALTALALLLSATGSIAGQPTEPEPRDGDTVIWYTVQPGDTLSLITRRFLGVDRLWPENHRLNPHVGDPALLTPGERLRIISERELPERSATVVEVARRVQEKPAQGAWTPTEVGNQLVRDDGLRTFRRSSAELSFDDGTNLRVTEDSIIFLRRVDEKLTGVKQQTIEIEEGGADLEASPRTRGRSEIEVIFGNATARPRAGASGIKGRLQTDAESGSSALMVYEGESSVAAGGATVEVPRGMGTAVPKDGAPAPPEPLLPPPGTLAPRASSIWSFSNPEFRWREIPGATAYEIEICRDSACGSLVDRASGIEETIWRPDGLPAGRLYWRVRATSSSGLDGYPSRANPFTMGTSEVPEPGPDLNPPVVALIVDRPGRSREGEIYLPANGAVRPVVQDDAAGVAEVQFRWNGQSWRSWNGRALRPPSEGSLHSLELRATDLAGRESVIVSARVHFLRDRPAAPTVTFEPGSAVVPGAND